MKIVNRETFLELPPGTLFSKYRHCYMEALEIKGDSLRNDYCFQQIAEAIACTSSVQHTDLLDDMATAGLSVPVDLNCQGRDGCFEMDQLFAVWEHADVEALVARLQQALIDGYAKG